MQYCNFDLFVLGRTASGRVGCTSRKDIERLFENVTVAVDDGDGIRIEGYASLPFPAQLTGIDSYVYLTAFSFLRFAF